MERMPIRSFFQVSHFNVRHFCFWKCHFVSLCKICKSHQLRCFFHVRTSRIRPHQATVNQAELLPVCMTVPWFFLIEPINRHSSWPKDSGFLSMSRSLAFPDTTQCMLQAAWGDSQSEKSYPPWDGSLGDMIVSS